MQRQSNLKITKKDLAPYVLMPGDPGRVDLIARYLQNGRLVSNYREFRVYTGNYKGIPVTVVSSGIGCPCTGLAVEEVINLGAKVLIRVGTCGGAWRRDIPLGSLIIPIACVRDEGTTKEYMPAEFPAVANLQVINALQASAQQKNARYFVGINRTHDAFYGADFSIKRWGEFLKDPRFKKDDSPIISSEMETAALLVIAALRGIKAGAILAVNATPEPLRDRLAGKAFRVVSETSKRVTQKTVEQMIEVALEAIMFLDQGGKKWNARKI